MKNMNIPIFIHHEGAQSFVRDCVEQAGEWNKRVILFGDKSNADMCREWLDVSRFSSPLWEEFKKYYKHMSFNNSRYEMLCFKRFFIYDDFMEKNIIKECICMDSDVLIYADFSKIIAARKCNAAFLLFENGSASAGSAYWRKEVLRKFLLYCIDIYKNHQDRLNDEWKRFQRNHLPGGICDMTLLKWWYADGGVENVWSWTKYSKVGVVDAGFSISSNYLENEYRMDKFKIGKRVIVKHGLPYFIHSEHGPVRALMIHFQGDKKVYMSYFRKHLKIAFWLPYINKIASRFINM